MSGNKFYNSLNNYSSKLSKSQQRHTIDKLDITDTNGFCSDLAIIWLKEQLTHRFYQRTQFPRLAHKNVVDSKRAKKVTGIANIMQKQARQVPGYSGSQQIAILARTLELQSKPLINWKGAEFSTLAGYLKRSSSLGKRQYGALISFSVDDSLHCIAFYYNQGVLTFFDANAGSYLINGKLNETNNVSDFIANYKSVCLPKKWPSAKIGDRLTTTLIHT
ncbi:hypothetical protein HWV03_05480 [Moritella sp. 36]|uniref:hypothetical protein n=1 Tax=Moritella sp. 36 TaxID=2746233 RepID=UPI001BADCEEB|nr:hypothetical protein [Moritella sp. 36]QUM88309.1 hypothetical protein HWV03_05480 [Moritella sp. 36]